MYPPLPFLNRECTKDYSLPGTDITIEKGTAVLIPMLALHRDERFYPEPAKFDPDRFNSDSPSGKNFAERPYFPFGDGPRVCIGLRMGKMQTKAGLILMLRRNRYELAQRHIGKDIKMSKKAFLLAPQDGLELIVSRR